MNIEPTLEMKGNKMTEDEEFERIQLEIERRNSVKKECDVVDCVNPLSIVNKQTLEDVLYIIEAFERGCFAEDYWMEIASIKTKLNTLMKELPNDPV